jgi:hypothetical protein
MTGFFDGVSRFVNGLSPQGSFSVDADALSGEISASYQRASDELNRLQAEADGVPDSQLSSSESVSSDSVADGVANNAPDGWDTAEKWATRILAAAITIHVASMFTTGIASGPPDAGDGLAAGVDAFQGASEILGSAGSDPGWQGPAAQSYNARNTEQQTRTDQMAALDTDLASLLQAQAAEVEKLRKDMYIVLGVLTSAKPIAMMLYKITPPVGPQLSTSYQIATAGACLTATTGLLSAQRVRSNKTGAALNNVAESYSQIADAAVAARPLH